MLMPNPEGITAFISRPSETVFGIRRRASNFIVKSWVVWRYGPSYAGSPTGPPILAEVLSSRLLGRGEALMLSTANPRTKATTTRVRRIGITASFLNYKVRCTTNFVPFIIAQNQAFVNPFSLFFG